MRRADRASRIAGTAVAEERKLITAVFSDLVGSTARSESLDVEDVKALVAPYHARLRAELEGHGGKFLQTIQTGVSKTIW